MFTSASELKFTSVILDADVRNNSAWSYRRKALAYHAHLVPDEIGFTLDKLRLAPGNESAWVYLRSLPGWCDDDRVIDFVVRFGLLPHGGDNVLMHIRDAVETLAILESIRGQKVRGGNLLEALSGTDTVRERSLRFRAKEMIE